MNKFPADNPFSKIQAFKSAIALSLIINIILMMGILYPDTRDFIRFLGDNGVKLGLFSCSLFICNLLLFFILFLFSFRFAKKGNESTKSAIKLTLGILLITLILSPSLSQFQWQIIQGNTVHGASEFTLFFLVKDLISGFVVMLITATINLGDKQKQALITNQQLVAENMKVKYEALAYYYGKENEESFNLPDLRSRFIIGYDSTKLDYDSIGKTGGAEFVKNELENIPKHAHAYTDDTNALGKFPSVEDGFPQSISGVNPNESSAEKAGWGTAYKTSSVGGNKDGATVPHENRPPYYVLAYVVKVKY